VHNQISFYNTNIGLRPANGKYARGRKEHIQTFRLGFTDTRKMQS